MKKVASTLRLDLASHREPKPFARFGSGPDEFIVSKLGRSRRIVEVLKQG